MKKVDNIEYIFTGKLNVEDTVRKIRDTRMQSGRYNGHSKYLWRILELRNEGLDNYEIAEKLSVENNTSINKQIVKNTLDAYKIESNPEKERNKRIRQTDIIMSKELFDKVDLESLKTGDTPAVIMQNMLGGNIDGVIYTDKRALRKIWDASYAKYVA